MVLVYCFYEVAHHPNSSPFPCFCVYLYFGGLGVGVGGECVGCGVQCCDLLCVWWVCVLWGCGVGGCVSGFWFVLLL